jgi:hypothetical protein
MHKMRQGPDNKEFVIKYTWRSVRLITLSNFPGNFLSVAEVWLTGKQYTRI